MIYQISRVPCDMGYDRHPRVSSERDTTNQDVSRRELGRGLQPKEERASLTKMTLVTED